MEYFKQLAYNSGFSPESAKEHLQKVISDPIFSVSDILKRFLSFIVQEKLEGRSNQLKEYTIGVNVLNKPSDFKPQLDAIVRIHACRLRRALNRYYDGAGKEDHLRISIPKGNYVPLFYEPGSNENPEENACTPEEDHAITAIPAHSISVAVMPLTYFGKGKTITSFAEGLASQLSTELAGTKSLAVIGYYPLRFLDEKPFYLRDITRKTGAQYLFTGDLHLEANRVRLNIKLIHANSCEQVWSRLFDRKLTATNMFDLQDEIIKNIIAETADFWMSKKSGISESSAMAVA